MQEQKSVGGIVEKYKSENPEWIETDINAYLNDYYGLETKYNIDILTPQAVIECKDDLSPASPSKQSWDKALYQAIQYDKRLILEGEKLPKYIIIIDYTNEKFRQYEIESVEFFSEDDEYQIEKTLINSGELSDLVLDFNELFVKYDISFDNADKIAQRLYEIYPSLNDGKIFDYLQTSEKDWFYKTTLKQQDFQIKLDLFNDPKTQKKRGAFYTPDRYIKISTQYLRDAIEIIKSQNYIDYVIIDRCAGSGQLEKQLTDEELSHCILSTIGISEWVSLWNLYGGKVRSIIPPYINGKKIDPKTKPADLIKQCDFNKNEMIGANALSSEYVENFKEIFEKRDKGELAIIMLENPPFSVFTDMDSMRKKAVGMKAEVFDRDNYKSDTYFQMDRIKNKRSLVTQFIWSAFTIYKCNYYVVYAPIQYWKINHVIDKEFISGYICNRKFFHATESSISLILWGNKDYKNEKLLMDGDWQKDDPTRKLTIEKIYSSQSAIIDKSKNEEGDFANWGVDGFDIVDNNYGLSDVRKRQFKLNEDNLMNMLPLWCSNDSFVLGDKYPNKGILARSSDGGVNYHNDADFLNDNLIYALLTNKNHCSPQCKIFPYGFSKVAIKQKHAKLFELWNGIYDKTKMYGLYNIINNGDNYYIDKKGKTQWKDEELGALVSLLKVALKQFYVDYIREKMLDYKLVK